MEENGVEFSLLLEAFPFETANLSLFYRFHRVAHYF